MKLELTPTQVRDVLDEYVLSCTTASLENLIVRCFARGTCENLDRIKTLKRMVRQMSRDCCMTEKHILELVGSKP